jgi:hypothetical protein
MGIYMLDGFIEELVMMSFILREPVSSLTVSKAAMGGISSDQSMGRLTLGTWCSSGTFLSLASDIVGDVEERRMIGELII